MLEADILIPCKRLREGKSRLAALLSADERLALCAAMLTRTLELAEEITRPDHIWLITGDTLAAERAKATSVSVIADESNDLNGALDSARSHILAGSGGPEALLVLPIDLIFADAAAVRSVAAGDYDVVLAPDTKKSGTNLLFLRGRAARAFPFRFGLNSLARHCDAAQQAGHSLNVIEDPALGFDLDEPDDYLRAKRTGCLTARDARPIQPRAAEESRREGFRLTRG